MKKLIVTVMLASILTTAAFSFNIGVGVNGTVGVSSYFPSTNVKQTFIANQKPALDVAGGVGGVVFIGFSKSLALQPEFNIIFGNVYGWKKGDNYQKTIATTFEIPVLLKFQTGTGFSLFVGPTFSFGVGDLKTKFNVLGIKTENSVTYENAKVNKFSMGFQAGLDYRLKMGLGSLVLGARFGMDLTDISSDKNFKKGNRWYARPAIAYIFMF